MRSSLTSQSTLQSKAGSAWSLHFSIHLTWTGAKDQRSATRDLTSVGLISMSCQQLVEKLGTSCSTGWRWKLQEVTVQQATNKGSRNKALDVRWAGSGQACWLLEAVRHPTLCRNLTGSARTVRAAGRSARRWARVAWARRGGRASANFRPRTARSSTSGRHRRSVAPARSRFQVSGVRSSRSLIPMSSQR